MSGDIKSEYPLSQWQLDAHAFWGSSGNQNLIPEELAERLIPVITELAERLIPVITELVEQFTAIFSEIGLEQVSKMLEQAKEWAESTAESETGNEEKKRPPTNIKPETDGSVVDQLPRVKLKGFPWFFFWTFMHRTQSREILKSKKGDKNDQTVSENRRYGQPDG